MGNESKRLMVITRIKSPPHENKRESIYCGEPVEVSEIPARLEFTRDSTNYFYTTHDFISAEEEFRIECRRYVYNGNSLQRDGVFGFQVTRVPIDPAIKKSLTEFVNSL